MNFHTRFDPPPSPCRSVGGRSMTHQEFAAECDINTIVARAGAGLVQLSRPAGPLFTDVSEVPTTYQECVEMLMTAEEQFASLPAKMRERFANDPGQLLDFLGNESNREEAIQLGLLAAPVVSPAQPVSELKQKDSSTSEPAS